MTKIIVANGAPNSGKDEMVSYLTRQYGVYPFSFKNALKRITLELYHLSEAKWDSWYTREGKELPRAELDGLSQRQAFIKVSEEIIKPHFGSSYFGKAEARRLKEVVKDNPNIVACCSDGGFNDEITPLVKEFGARNVHIVAIHRQGCSFSGDSRGWINTKAVPPSNYWTINNNSSLDEYWKNISSVYESIVN